CAHPSCLVERAWLVERVSCQGRVSGEVCVWAAGSRGACRQLLVCRQLSINSASSGGERLAAMTYLASPDRYSCIPYRRCGRSGIHLPEISLGLWQNFGDITPLDTQRAIIRRAFDLGVTHFDLANNYGPPYGTAEKNF